MTLNQILIGLTRLKDRYGECNTTLMVLVEQNSVIIRDDTGRALFSGTLDVCSCVDKNTMSQMSCRIHGVSEQLNRTQME